MIGDTPNSGRTFPHIDQPPTTSNHMGPALPPIPPKLIEKIKSGTFIEMTNLLPEHLGPVTMEDEGKLKQKHKQITSITEWLKSFAVYDVAVIANKQPKRIPDLMEYQILILEAYTEYKNDCWLSYDQKFHQRAACLPHISWSTIDSTLWNLAFAGQAKSDHCKHCFSLSHSSRDCDLAWDTTRKPQFRSQ